MILAVVGPTGVGKTKMSVELAKKYNAIIINCDATQVYQELNIGSAKVTEEEKEGIQHYLIDFVLPSSNYTVSDYQNDLRKILDDNKDKNIVIVGGTGLYLTAGIMDYRFESDVSNYNYDDLTNEELYDLALKKDNNCKIHKNNRVRLVRFLNKDNTSIVQPVSLYDVLIIGLTTNRENLYNIINNRVDKMIDGGLVDEVKYLHKKYPESNILNRAIGYKEIIGYLDGKYLLTEAVDLIKKNSRHYAKRQYTWFNNKLNVNWFYVDYENFSNTIKEVESFIDKKIL